MLSCYVRWARSVQTHVLGTGLLLRARYTFLRCKNLVAWGGCVFFVGGVLFVFWLWMVKTEPNDATVGLLSVMVFVLLFLIAIVSSIRVREDR